MKRYILLFILPVCFGCKAIKTVRILKKGEVVQKEFKVEIPFEYRLGLIILKVDINGKAHDFVLDTGAPNVISTQLAEELNIKAAVSEEAVDSEGEKSKLGFAEIPDLSIGGIHFTNTGTAIADLSQSTEIGCLGIDGFIGANLMRKAIWHFDYQKQLITISHTKSNFAIPADAKVIPFKPKLTGTPLIDITYNGVTDKHVTFDLGSNGSFASSEKVLKEVRPKDHISSVYGVGNNVSGLFGQSTSDTTTYAIIPRVESGELELLNQVVSFSANKARTIGTEIFRHYRIIIDWGKEEITMIPAEDYSNSELKTFGISPIFKENKLFVGFLYHGSLAQQQGIAVGDQILEINGKDFRSCSIEQWCIMMDKGYFPKDSETNAVVLLKDGEEKLYTLKREVILK